MKNDYQPNISIIIPVYKTEKYITRCLESIINQTFRDIEIICVNDGSPDNALAICEEYAQKDDRIVLLSQTNQGLSAARNTGLLHAHGKYIQFCDSDDFFDLTMCEKMYNAIITSGTDIVVANINIISDNIPFWGDENYFKIPFLEISKITDETFKRINVFAWNKIYKKDLIEKYNITFPHGLYYEDASFLFKYLTVSEAICCINDQLYNYICRSDSIMLETFNNKPDYAIDHIYIIKDVADFLYTHGFEKKYEEAFIWMVLSYTNLACIHGKEKTYSKAFEVGSILLKNIDFNTLMKDQYNRDEVLRLYALKKGDQDMYFSVDKINKENTRLREENQKFCNENQRLREENQRLSNENQKFEADNKKLRELFTITFNKSLKEGLFFPTLLACILFPWYIYNIFYIVYNNKLPKLNIKYFIKAYLFFPYYALKTYFTLILRKNKSTI